jgi:predicted MPP superfamily phosphohydrolase
MKRREFFQGALLVTGAPGVLVGRQTAAAGKGSRLRTIHSSEEMKTTIHVEGLSAPVKMMHITDTHISRDDASDQPFEQYSTRMRNAYASVKHYSTGQASTPAECFKELLKIGSEQKADLLALTGDIVNYPSAAAVEFVRGSLAGAGIPHLYTAGNHDWHYEGLKGSSESLRKEWREKRLKPLYGQHGASCSVQAVKGINFVAIDDATYQVDEEQLAFYRQQAAKNLPLVLLMHIPVYVPGMKMSCGHPDWGAAADRGFETERRERWSEKGNLPSTVAFVKAVKETPCLAAVFTGHWHSNSVAFDQNMVQYVTLLGAVGRYRMVEFLPMGSPEGAR